jgi:hypothetical protein
MGAAPVENLTCELHDLPLDLIGPQAANCKKGCVVLHGSPGGYPPDTAPPPTPPVEHRPRSRRNGRAAPEPTMLHPGGAPPAESRRSPNGQNTDNDASGFPVLTLAMLRERYSGTVEWLVEGYIALGELTLVPGAPESLKSWAMTDLARAVHTGGQWLGEFDVPQGSVLYIEQERVGNLVYQLGLLEQAYGTDLGGLCVLPPEYPFRLADPTTQANLKALVAVVRPVLVIINSWRSVFRGDPGNGVATAAALGWLGNLADSARCAVAIVDQTTKAGGAGLTRGMAAHADSLQKEYEADAVLHVERGRDAVGHGVGPARLYVGKRRAGDSGPPFRFEVLPHQPAGVLVHWQGVETVERANGPAAPTAAARVLTALQAAAEPLSPATLAVQTGIAEKTVRNTLSRLKAAGQAEQAHYGGWQAVSQVSHAYRDRDSWDTGHAADSEAEEGEL